MNVTIMLPICYGSSRPKCVSFTLFVHINVCHVIIMMLIVDYENNNNVSGLYTTIIWDCKSQSRDNRKNSDMENTMENRNYN